MLASSIKLIVITVFNYHNPTIIAKLTLSINYIYVILHIDVSIILKA